MNPARLTVTSLSNKNPKLCLVCTVCVEACVCVSDRLLLRPQVNNATARVMTNKKMVSPYPNGEALSTLPYGNNRTAAH